MTFDGARDLNGLDPGIHVLLDPNLWTGPVRDPRHFEIRSQNEFHEALPSSHPKKQHCRGGGESRTNCLAAPEK
jgi:hypothetical protein